MMRTLPELQAVLLRMPCVLDAEIEGEEPACLRVEISSDAMVESVTDLCMLLDWSAIKLRNRPAIVIEEQ